MKTKPIPQNEAPEATSSHNTIASELVQKLVNNYRNNQLIAVNNELGINDAFSIWFDLPKLKNFISCIENEAKNVDPNATTNDLGVRFYYAAYPKAEDWSIMNGHPISQEYAEKHTLVLVPTLKKKDETGKLLNYDFNCANGMMMSTAAKTIDPSEETIAENHGTLSPPSDPKTQQF
ncbi:hypothetical protein [Chryseobacterium fistulae]|uniref:Uncharacterized protein n=1 Tax=Chryseobacterium fistulae TaxID=2675058 RepID=A0A6N4XV65_9FLAO|nr:hypothetical protein [Chryseobacterium fistulae]CAA7388145.1 hypothetical protein CHRY9393_01890 [Chryseobacterium fistulae]